METHSGSIKIEELFNRHTLELIKIRGVTCKSSQPFLLANEHSARKEVNVIDLSVAIIIPMTMQTLSATGTGEPSSKRVRAKRPIQRDQNIQAKTGRVILTGKC
jgi:hypothetical protein